MVGLAVKNGRKNVQVVTDLLFPVVVTSLEQVQVITLLQLRLVTVFPIQRSALISPEQFL